jgi:CBS-domain-containing membrane protein
VRLGVLAIPLADLATTTVAEPLVELLGRLDEDEAGARAAVLDDEGRIAGFVLPEDVARAVEVGRLRPRTRADRGGQAGRPAPDAGA